MDVVTQIQTVRGALARARAGADGVSDDTERGQAEKAVDTLQRAVDSWAGDLLDRVNQGTYSADQWTSYGNDLEAQANRFADQYKSIFETFSNFFIKSGEAAISVEDFIKQKVDALSDQVNALDQQLQGFYQSAQAVEAARQQLGPVQSGLSSDAQDLLFGAGYQLAMVTLGTFEGLVSGLQEAIAAIRQGTLHPVVDRAKGDLIITQQAAAGLSGLGVLPAAIIGVGLISALGMAIAAATSLQAYFAHASEVITANSQHELNQMRANGQISEATYAAATKSGHDSKPPPPPGFGDVVKKIEEAIVTGLEVTALVGVAYVAWTNRETIKRWVEAIVRRLTA